MVAQAVRMTCSPYAITGFSAGKQKQMLHSPVSEGTINLVCSFLGANWLGATGVAMGSLIGALAGVLFHLLVSIPRTQNVTRLERSASIWAVPSAFCWLLHLQSRSSFSLITGRRRRLHAWPLYCIQARKRLTYQCRATRGSCACSPEGFTCSLGLLNRSFHDVIEFYESICCPVHVQRSNISARTT